jgi:NADP-dependent 3-hydroxy acid dehydrogenase YdfG
MVRTEISVASGISKETSDKIYDERIVLVPLDIAEALFYALTTPSHVQV